MGLFDKSPGGVATGGTGLFGNEAQWLSDERDKISARHTRDWQDRQNPYRMLGGALKAHNLRNSPEARQMRDTQTLMSQIDTRRPEEVEFAIQKLTEMGNIKGAFQLRQIAADMFSKESPKTFRQEVFVDGKKRQGLFTEGGELIRYLGDGEPAKPTEEAGPLEDWYDPNTEELIGHKQKQANGTYKFTRLKQSPLVDMSSGEKVKFSMKEFEKATDQASAAEKQIANLDYIDATLKGIETGSLTDLKVALGQLSASLNLPISEDISKLEGARTAAGNMVMAMLDNFPGQISNQERQFLEGRMPALTQTREGREAISIMLRRAAERALAKQEIMSKYIRGKVPDLAPIDGQTFYEEWKQYKEDNPLYADLPAPTGKRAVDAGGTVYFESLDGLWRDKNGNLWGAEQ